MIVEAILVGMFSLGFLIIQFAMTNVVFRESHRIVNETIYNEITGGALTRADNVMNTILASFGITMIIVSIGIVVWVYVNATKREVLVEAL